MSRFAPVFLVLCLALTACGFEPLYGDREQTAAAEDLLELVDVPPIADRVGQLVRIELTNRLTPTQPAPPALYTLPVLVTESRVSLAVRKDSSATRANLTINASFELYRISDGVRLTSGTIRSVNSYDVVDSDYATLVAESDARRRGAKDTADQIVDRLAIYLSRAQQIRASGNAR